MIELPDLTPQQVAERLEACCICVGYLMDSARFEMKDQVQPEVKDLVRLLRHIEAEADEQLLAMAENHANAWVRYHVITSIWREYPDRSRKVLEGLIRLDGFVAAAAMLAMHHIGTH